MKLAVFTSGQKRHKWLLYELLNAGHELVLVVAEQKKMTEKTPDKTVSSIEDSILVAEHFLAFQKAESDFFPGVEKFPDQIGELIETSWGGLNAPNLVKKILSLQIDNIVIFGSSIIKEPILSAFPEKMLNIHQGLSPYYRGTATNFWPFYNQELQYVGVTLHYIDSGIDSGNIIAHARPDIQSGDDQYIIGCRTIKASVELVLKALKLIEQGKTLLCHKQWLAGKLYRRNDFSEEAVVKVRKLVSDGMVEDYVRCQKKKQIPEIELISLNTSTNKLS